MITTDPTLQTNASRGQVQSALAESSSRTGADFHYLLKVAERESHMRSTAQAPNSSAAGVFQFNEQTWLAMVKQSGAKFGLGTEASEISSGPGGRQEVSDPAARQAILAERNDPRLAALMAGQLANQNRSYLQKHLGRPVSDGEVYAAHIFGAGGALKLINAADGSPDQAAASVLPTAARANHNLFYSRHQPRTAEQVMARLDSIAGGPSPAMPAPAGPTPAANFMQVADDSSFDARPTAAAVPVPLARPSNLLTPDTSTALAEFTIS